MATLPLDSLSPFGRLAVTLDNDFSELARIGSQIERIAIDSDSGLDHALKLLTQFAQHGQSIADNIHGFSKALQEARDKSEAAAKLVSERAGMIQQRKEQRDQVQTHLTQLEQKLKAASAGLASSRKQSTGELSPDEKRHVMAQLEQFHSQLTELMEGAEAIKAEAGQAKFKGIEREAQSLLEALRFSRRKISKAIS